MKFKARQKIAASVFAQDEAGGLKQKYEAVDVENLHPLVLAFVLAGVALFEGREVAGE